MAKIVISSLQRIHEDMNIWGLGHRERNISLPTKQINSNRYFHNNKIFNNLDFIDDFIVGRETTVPSGLLTNYWDYYFFRNG